MHPTKGCWRCGSWVWRRHALLRLLPKNLLLRSTLAMLPGDSASFSHARTAVWESVSASMI